MAAPNPELLLADQFVRHTDCPIFLTGRAGTGKTTFLQGLQQRTAKRLVVTAPTGVAAINAGGVTLHSFFQLPFGPIPPGDESLFRQHRIRKEKQNLMRSLDLLVIDEISMVRADLLDAVDTVLRHRRRSDQPFGGLQLLMIGDLHQLAPVAKPADWQLLHGHYDSPYFFSARALARTELVTIELRHIYRQSDNDFIELLARVRDNDLDPDSMRRINSRYHSGLALDAADDAITLCTHNHSADAINRTRLAALPGPCRRLRSERTGDFPESSFPAASLLEVKPGAQVMFVRNDPSPTKNYFNGKIGKITRIADDGVEVLCPGDAEPITVGKVTWENIDYRVDPETAEISQEVVGTFTQFPLKLAWAITIHKSQGLTFERAVIDARAAFAPGQVYVALSRCRTFDGLVLTAPLPAHAVKTDPLVQRFTAATAGRRPSPETLEAAAVRYQQRLLLECFDFARLRRLLGRLADLLNAAAQSIQVTGDGDWEAARRQVGAEICLVGEKFKRQLTTLFPAERLPAADPTILERLAKASVYFEDRFEHILLPRLEHFAVETDNRDIRRTITQAAKLLQEETALKLAAVRSCREGFSAERYLRALSVAAMASKRSEPNAPAPSFSEADVGHPELFEQLKKWRRRKAAAEGIAHFQVLHRKTLVQIAVHLPDSIPALKKIKGIGTRLAERYGEEITAMVAAYRRTQGTQGGI